MQESVHDGIGETVGAHAQLPIEVLVQMFCGAAEVPNPCKK